MQANRSLHCSAPVAILVGEDVGAGICHCPSKPREEHHVLGGAGDEVRAAVFLSGSLLAIPVHPRQQRVHMRRSGDDNEH